jgi:GPH family glycoside/pentoside/hexuronide:cation symporter
MNNSAPTESGRTRYLSIPVMLAYGIGDLAQAAMNVGVYGLLLFYYQQIVGLSGTLTGLALGIALVFDAVTDPIVGGWSDRLKGRFGRRHPMMALAAVPLAISFVFLFSPPEGLPDFGKFLWLTVFAVLVRTAMTFYHIPHLALGAEMASDYHQRSTLFAFSALIGGLAYTAIGVATYWVFFPTTEEFDPGLLNPAGYPAFAWTAGLVMIVALMICVFGTAREIPHLRDPELTTKLSLPSLLEDMREVFRDRDFFVIFAGFILWYLFGFIESVGQPYMGVHFWGLPTEQIAYFYVVSLVAFPISFLLVPVVTRKLDKKMTLLSSSLAVIILPNVLICLRLFAASWYPENGSPWVLINLLSFMFVSVCTYAICGATYSSIYADLADAHELRTHKRREGAIYSTRSFANKAAGALGLMIGGMIIDAIAFPENATLGSVPDDVVWNLGFFVGPATSIFSLMGIMLFIFYRMDKTRHAEIVQELAARRAK